MIRLLVSITCAIWFAAALWAHDVSSAVGFFVASVGWAYLWIVDHDA